jgi:hypothetical protein
MLKKLTITNPLAVCGFTTGEKKTNQTSFADGLADLLRISQPSFPALRSLISWPNGPMVQETPKRVNNPSPKSGTNCIPKGTLNFDLFLFLDLGG